MGKKFIGVILTAAVAMGLAGCGDLGGIDMGVAAADTQATEIQKEEAKGNAKKKGEEEDSEAFDNEGASDFRIGIITGSVSQSEYDRRGAKAFQVMYDEGMIKLATYPDSFTEELETTIQTIVDLPDDPKMKTITVNQSVPDATEVSREVKETHPDILRIAGEGYEDPPEIDSVAGLVYNNDFVARGYLAIRTARELGCDTFVHIFFPRHMAYETMNHRVAVMEEACKEFSMEFVSETTSDPTSDVGAADAQAYTLEKVPEWVEKYGKNIVYFCTNDIHTEPLLKQLIEHSGYFVEADLPPPLMGYPGTLGIDLTTEAGDFDKTLTKVESTAVERGGTNHFGTWVHFYEYTMSAGLAQHTLNVLNGESRLDDIDDIAKIYQVFSPRAEWSSSSFTNVEASVKLDNVLLVYQDTYIMGDPGHFAGSTKIKASERYFTIK